MFNICIMFDGHVISMLLNNLQLLQLIALVIMIQL